MKSIKIVFMGSPEFSIPSLEALIENFSVVGVVTQPDKPAGRGKELKAPPIKEIAQQHGLNLIQPRKLSDEGVFDVLKNWDPDVIIVVAFGQILRKNVLELPKYGCVNIHGSLLPRWRGAAPIQTSILHGDEMTGITIMKMDEGVDTGPILQQEFVPITDVDTSESLGRKLSVVGADLLVRVLPDYIGGKIKPQTQSEDGVSYAPTLKKEDGLLVFNQTAKELDQKIRAFYPWPGTYMTINDERIKVISASVQVECNLEIGQRAVCDGFPLVGTRDGCLRLEMVQPAGKKQMSGKVFLNGFRNW